LLIILSISLALFVLMGLGINLDFEALIPNSRYYSSLGHTPYETIYAIDLIPDILSKELSQLLGFFIHLESHNPSNSIRFFPNIHALNARFELLKHAARSIYDIPGSENIADISFYLSPTKDFSSFEYLKQVALGRFPLTTFLDGGGILAFHDLIHTAQLVLTRDLLQGYGDLVKDFLMFLEFLSDDDSFNILTDRMGRMIDLELANFIWYFMAHSETAIRDTLKMGIDENHHFFEDLVMHNLQKQADLTKALFMESLDTFKKKKNSGQHNAMGYSAAEAPNSFIDRVNFLIDTLVFSSEEDEFYLRTQLSEFLNSNYGIEHNIQNKIYFSNGYKLYTDALKHRHFMQTLATHEGIRELLKFPQQK
jgi:hypothetical protein